MKRLAFLAAGVVLFALPFLSLGVGSGHHDEPGPHMDHRPRYGGQLMMIGEYHLEIVDAAPAIEVYPSDARRRPLTPASGRVAFDAAPPRPLTWQRDRLVAPTAAGWQRVAVEVTLSDGQILAVRVARTAAE
ncbi:MAG: hypothetical protein ABI629_23390 [bacterium]